MKTVVLIVGARPNFMKAAPIYHALKSHTNHNIVMVHTGQHNNKNMSDVFLDLFDLPKDMVKLNIEGRTQNTQTAEIITKLEEWFLNNPTDMVMVFGDVTSTFAGALSAVRMGIPVAHVEAGNRSFDKRMPEEVNRLMVDTISTYHFVAEPTALTNLANEGYRSNPHLNGQTIFYVGNSMIDTLFKFKDQASTLSQCSRYNFDKKGYLLVTLHRPSNVDDQSNLKKILDAFTSISQRVPIVFPVHPRRRDRIQKMIQTPNIILTEPLPYLEFLSLHMDSKAIVTDSGGLQEESTALGVPCLTLRENTERPITITHGTNTLLKKIDTDKIIKKMVRILDNPPIQKSPVNLWDGHAGERIARIVDTLF